MSKGCKNIERTIVLTLVPHSTEERNDAQNKVEWPTKGHLELVADKQTTAEKVIH